MSPTSRQSLVRLLEPVVAEAGLDLEDVQVTPAGRRRLLRVVVDRDGGVSLDDVAAVSSRLSAHLDEVNGMGATPYVLEVSSPGAERVLSQPRHWRRAAGRLAAVTLRDGRELCGRVGASGESGVTIEMAGAAQDLPWDSIRSARVQVEFSSPAAGHERHADGPDQEEG